LCTDNPGDFTGLERLPQRTNHDSARFPGFVGL